MGRDNHPRALIFQGQAPKSFSYSILPIDVPTLGVVNNHLYDYRI